MEQLTKRQLRMLTNAALQLRATLIPEPKRKFAKVGTHWDEDKDGPIPTDREWDELHRILADAEEAADEPPDDTPMKDGKPYVTDPDKVLHALLLTDAGMSADKPLGPCDDELLEKAIAGWTDDQRAAAFEWAALSHLHASDNDDVVVPECPPHVEELRPKYGSK